MIRRGTSLFLAAASIAGLAWGEAGLTSGGLLRRTAGARPMALGEAGAALSGDLGAVAYNPASLAQIRGPEIQTSYFRGLADDQLATLNYGHAVRWGAFFVGGTFFDAGEVDFVFSSGLQETRTAEQDTVAMLGVAVGRRSPLSAGVVAKGYRFVLAEEAHATGGAVDAGLSWRTPLSGFTLGAALLHAGSAVEFEVESDPLPRTVQYGLAYEITWRFLERWVDEAPRSLLVVDGVHVREEEASVHAGIELRQPMIIGEYTGDVSLLRLGYLSEEKTVTAGIGFSMGGFSMDYSIHFPDEDFSETHRATLNYRFYDREDAAAEARPAKATTPGTKPGLRLGTPARPEKSRSR